MKNKRIKLQDIADELGITKMTVSRYIKDPSLVSVKLGKDIQSLLDRYNYIPNRLPSLLSGKQTKIIGVLLPSLTNNVFSEVLRGIETITDKFGYQTMLAHYGYDAHKEEQCVMSLLSYKIDAIILSERYHTPKTKKILKAAEIPIVEMMDSQSPALDMCVGFDNQLAAYEITRSMIHSGKSQIAYFGARQDERTLIKSEGYKLAMSENHLKSFPIFSTQASSLKLGAEMLQEALLDIKHLDGIVCTNDDLAAGALFECMRRNIDVPQNIAIAGFHGLEFSQSMHPKLASVITPRFEMGQIAAKQILNRLLDLKEVHPNNINLGYTLSLGQSI